MEIDQIEFEYYKEICILKQNEAVDNLHKIELLENKIAEMKIEVKIYLKAVKIS